MKLRLAFTIGLALCLAGVPAGAQTIYSNGPIDGSTDAWTVDFGYIVSDTFTVGSGGATMDRLSFGAWILPGDVLLSTEIIVSSSEFGGTTFTDQTVNITQSSCSGNQFGYNVCTASANLLTPVNLAAGSYWLNLANAVTNTGDPIYWDENSGPSQASENSVGTIPSESFTVLGTTSTTGTAPTPEPSGIVLLGSGILGLAGVLRRKLF